MGLGAQMANAVRAVVARATDAMRPVTGRVVHVGRTTSGVYVDAETALKNAVVWACISYLSKTIAQTPWRVHKPKAGGGSELATTAPADYLLHVRPNAEMGAFTFRQTLMFWVLRYGNAYCEIEWDQRGAPYALWPLHPDRVVPRRTAAGVLYYEVWNERGGMVEMAAEDMLHFRGFGDGPVGFNVMEYAAQSIGWAQATQLFGASFFGAGMNPSGVVEVDKALSEPAMKVLRDQLKKIYEGPKGEKTVILDNKMTWKKVTNNPDEAQFIESMEYQVPEICRWFGVPPHKVMHLLNATFSNIEHQSIEVVVDSVTPWCVHFEQEVDFKLFGRANPQRLYSKMNLRSLLRGDNASRAAFYKELFYAAALTPNMICELEDIAPGGPDGDVRFVPVNMQPLKEAVKPKPAAAPGAAPPPPIPGADTDADAERPPLN